MGEDAHVTGTLDTNVYDDRAILLQLNLPDFDAQLVFPSVITRDSWFVVGLMILQCGLRQFCQSLSGEYFLCYV